jgi:hypothetical protein
MDGRQFQSLAAAGSGQDGITKTLEECLFAFQHIFVIVDAKKHLAVGLRVDVRGGAQAVQNCLESSFFQHPLLIMYTPKHSVKPKAETAPS